MGVLSFFGGLLGIGPTRRTIQTSKSATNAGLPFILGETRVPALPVFTEISKDYGVLGSSNWDFHYLSSSNSEENKGAKEWLHRIDVFAQGPISGYTKFIVDNDGHTDFRFKERAYLRIVGYYGDAGQTAFNWDSGVTSRRGFAHVGNAVAYTVSRFYAHGSKPRYNSEPPMEAIVKGSPLYDPRPAAAQSAGNVSTYTYNDNPALGLLTYLISDLGAAWPVNNIDLDSFMVGADFCDQLVALPAPLINTTGLGIPHWKLDTGEPGITEPDEDLPFQNPDLAAGQQVRVAVSLALNPENGVKGNIEEILTVMHGHLPFSNGKYKLIIEDEAIQTAMNFDDDSILGNWRIKTAGRKDRLNRATVTFFNKLKKYKEDSVSWPEIGSIQHTTYLSEDSGQKLQQTFEVSGLSDYHRAEDWAERKVRGSRAEKQVTVDLAPIAMLLEYGDVIGLTSTLRGWTDKWFRVRKNTLKSDGTCTVELVEYDGTIYPWGTKANEPYDDPPTTGTPWADPVAITGLAAVEFHEANTDGTAISGFDVSWDAPIDAVEIEFIEIAHRKSLTIDYKNISRVPVDNTTVQLSGLQDGEDYDIRITYRTALGLVSAEADISFQSLSSSGSRITDIEDGATVNRPMFGLEAGQDESGANVQALRIIGFDAVLTPVSVSLVTNIPYDGGFINPTAGYKSVSLISTDAPDGSYYVGYDKTKTQKLVMAGITDRDMGIIRKNGAVWEYLDYVTAGSYAWVAIGFVDDCIVIGEAHIANSSFSVATAYAQGVDLSSVPALGADVTDYTSPDISNDSIAVTTDGNIIQFAYFDQITNVIDSLNINLLDALGLLNGPAAAGADVTGDNTSNDTTNVNSVSAVTVEANAQTGYNLTKFNGTVLDGSSLGLLDLDDLDPTRRIKLDGVQANATDGDPYGGSYNLLGADAGPEHSYTTSHTYISPTPITNYGLVVGDVLSVSADLKTDGTVGEDARVIVKFTDSGGGYITEVTVFTDEAITEYIRLGKVFTIPTNTANIQVFAYIGGGSTGIKYIKKAMLNRGPNIMDFVGTFEDGATDGDPYGGAVNLLGADAGSEITVTADYHVMFSATKEDMEIEDGEPYSFSYEVLGDGVLNSHIEIYFIGAAGDINVESVVSAAGVWDRREVHNEIWPAGATAIQMKSRLQGATAVTYRKAMLNRGRVALTYIAPYEDGATDGATWGSNVTDQPSDYAILNGDGDNLFPFPKLDVPISSFPFGATNSWTIETDSTFGNVLRVVTTDNNFIFTRRTPAKKDDIFYYSFWAKVTTGTTGQFNLRLQVARGDHISYTWPQLRSLNLATASKNIWVRYTGSMLLTSTDAAEGDFYFDPVTLVGSVDIAQVKISRTQEGADVTDYTNPLVSNVNNLPQGMHIGGFGDVKFLKNVNGAGSANDGEIQVLGTKFYHPDGTTRILATNDGEISTAFEGVVVSNGLFYVVWTDTDIDVRFAGHFTAGLANKNYFIAQYDWVNSQWFAKDNGQVVFNFTPTDTDCIVAVGDKTSTSGGMDILSSLMGVNTDLPADGADITANSQFTPTIFWNFDNTQDGWSNGSITTTLNPAYMSVQSTGADPTLSSPLGLNINGATNTLVMARVRRTAGTGWDSTCYYTTSGHGSSESYRRDIPDTTIIGEWVTLVWDMENLVFGGTDWTDNTITGIRLDLGSSATDDFDIDWIAVGRIAAIAGNNDDIIFPNLELENPDGRIDIKGTTLDPARTTGLWDSQVYTKNGFVGSAYVTWEIDNTSTSGYMMGLSEDPIGGGVSYGGIFAFYKFSTTTLRVYEYGAFVADVGSYVAGDRLSVVWDGVNVKYYKNLTLIYTSLAPPNAGAKMYMDSSFRHTTSKILNLSFGQGPTQTAAWSGIDDDDGNRPADGADVTGDNTAADTSNINGFTTSNIFDGNGRFKDLERVPATRAMGTGSARTSNPLTASDDGATAKISIAAHTIYVGDGTGIAYNAGTITGLSFSTAYAVYVDDATFAGGAVTYVATINFEDLGKALGRYYIGYVDTPADGGGSTGGGGGGGGEACIADDMWLTHGLLARDARSGDRLDLLDEIGGVANGDGYRQASISGVSHSVQPCFKIETSGGAKLICSDTTPITLRTGEMMMVGDCLGGELATVIDGHFEWQEVTKVEAVDPRIVAHIHIGGRTFAAGAEARARIFTHNMAKPLI